MWLPHVGWGVFKNSVIFQKLACLFSHDVRHEVQKGFANSLVLFVFLCALLAQALNTWERFVVCVPGSVKLAWPVLNVCASCIV